MSFPLVRVAVTLAVYAVLLAARHVTLPGVDREMMLATDMGSDAFSVVVLSVMTWMTSYTFVELGALTRKRWRALRVGGPAERARLERATRIVWVFVAAAQGFAITVSLEQIVSYDGLPLVADPGWAFRGVALVTMMAGSGLVWLGARIIDRWGFGNGFAVLSGLMLAEQILPGLSLHRLFEEPYHASLAPVVVALAAVVYGTWRLPRLWSADGTLPLFTAGITPVALAVTWPTVPAILGFEPLSDTTSLAATGVLAVVGALLYGTLFHLPWNVAPVAGNTEAEAAAALRGTLPFAVLLVAAAALLSGGTWTGPVALDIAGLAIVSAHAWDLHAEWRARAELGDVEVAWPLHRVYALPPVLRALEQAGVPARVRGVRFRQLAHFFGPHVPIEILVPRGRVAEARTAIAAALAG